MDDEALAQWAHEHSTTLTLLVRPGSYLFPGVPVAELGRGSDASAAQEALRGAFILGPRQAEVQDLEFAVRQLVEVAVRALSPGINDPFTAIAVLDRLGASLCEIVPRHLPGNVLRRDDQIVLYRQVTDYEGLCDTMFHMIRQNASGSPAVLIRLMETLGRVMSAETQPERLSVLRRHAYLTLTVGRTGITNSAGLADLEKRFKTIVKPSPN